MRMRNVLFVMLQICLFSTLANGQNQLSIGVNYLTAMPHLTGDDFKDITVDSKGLPGGFVQVNYERFIVAAEYNAADFMWNYKNPEQKVNVNRSDITFKVGYEMSRNLHLFAAMKQLNFQGNSDDFGRIDGVGVQRQFSYALGYKGILIGGGISAVMQFPHSPFFLKWSAAYLSGEMELEKTIDDKLEDDYPRKHSTALTDIFIGLGYRTESGLSFLVGYKAGFSGEEQGEERMHGLLATLSFNLNI